MKIPRDLHLTGDPDRSIKEAGAVIGLFGGGVALVVAGLAILAFLLLSL